MRITKTATLRLISTEVPHELHQRLTRYSQATKIPLRRLLSDWLTPLINGLPDPVRDEETSDADS